MSKLPPRALAIGACAMTLLLAPTASAATTLDLGPGREATVAVDAAGTAYVVSNGLETADQHLHYCRLPRGATTCDVAKDLGSVAGSTVTRPYVFGGTSTVQVLTSRYGFAGPEFNKDFLLTSTDGGQTFGAPVDVGNLAAGAGGGEAVFGPGAGVSLLSNNGTRYQHLPADGSARAVASAALNPGYDYNGSVGLATATTPVVTSETAAGTAAFTYYKGSGDPNDAANWQPTQVIGPGSYGRLAGGPAGLFLSLSVGNGAGSHLEVRRFDPFSFGAPTAIPGSAGAPDTALFQDAGGLVQAAWPRNALIPKTLSYSTSRDGVTWTAPTEITSPETFGGVRLATAADHGGFAVWTSGQGATARIKAAPLPLPPAVDSRAPKISRLSVSRKRFRAKGKKAGTRFRYRLSEAAKVRITIARRTAGRRAGRRYVKVGTLVRRGKRGVNTTKFSGRLKGRPLRSGRYRATITAIDAAGNRSVSRNVSLTVLHPPSPCRLDRCARR